MPSKCSCGQKYNLNNATNCKRGGFIVMRYNSVKNFEAKTIQNDVEIKHALQKIDNDRTGRHRKDGTRRDIRARGV